MSKKIVLITIIGFIVLAAGIFVLFFLPPMQKTQTESGPEFNDAWKLECIQGIWASSDKKYELAVDGYDCTLKMDGVYAVVASVQFDTLEKPQEGNDCFTMQVDPSSVIYPDAQGAYYCQINALWYEDGTIYLRLNASDHVAPDTVCLTRVETSLPEPEWSLN